MNICNLSENANSKNSNELQNDFESFVNLYKEMKRNDITIDEMWEGLETYLTSKQNLLS